MASNFMMLVSSNELAADPSTRLLAQAAQDEGCLGAATGPSTFSPHPERAAQRLQSKDPAAESGGLQRVLAGLPVARAQLVGLQRVEDAQHLLRVAADREVVDAGV